MSIFVCLLTRFNHSRLNITNSAEELKKIIEIITTDISLIAEWKEVVNHTMRNAALFDPMPDKWPVLLYRYLIPAILYHCQKRGALARAEQLASALPVCRGCRP